MPKISKAEAAIDSKIKQLATAILKEDDVLPAKDRAAIVAEFMAEHASVVIAVLEGQLALATSAVLGDDEDAEDDEDEDDSDEGDAEDDSDEGDAEDEDDDE